MKRWRLKATGVKIYSKIDARFRIFTSVKVRGELVEMCLRLFQLRPKTQPLLLYHYLEYAIVIGFTRVT